MRLVADEGVERQIVEQLRADGHEVVYVVEGTKLLAAPIAPARFGQLEFDAA